MPYIFFKIKNCLNDDLFISCDDRIGKMLHNSGYVTQVSDLWPVGLLLEFLGHVQFIQSTCIGSLNKL